MNLYRLVAPLIHCLPPEYAHHLAIRTLQKLGNHRQPPTSPLLSVNTLGMTFSNPIGLAAGFDKNAEAINGAFVLGFGSVEVGTVTPRSQHGNPKPRLFRLIDDRAVINRMGFNNEGLAPFVQRLAAHSGKGIVGANIGKNKDTVDAVSDYVEGIRAVYPHCDYITVNISSPNTPGLRDLQASDVLGQLLSTLKGVREELISQHGFYRPLLIKIAPDLNDSQQENIAQTLMQYQVDGVIVGNTTISRPESLRSHWKHEEGGLSGAPLFELSTRVLARMYRLTEGKIPLIGVGGIASARDAYVKIRAGATLVQLYSAMVYEGPGLVHSILRELPTLLEQDGFSRIQEAVGVDV